MASSSSSSCKRFLLLYGSQTGQAKAIAEQIHEKCIKEGFTPDIHCISDSDKKFNIEKEPIVVVIVSTTGDGEPPDTVLKFWRKLKRKSNPLDMLKHVNYALLGLGDTNYTNFCNMGKMLNERLLKLGATPFYETGFADDGIGLEIVVEPWMAGLPHALQEVFTKSVDSPLESGSACKDVSTSIQNSDESTSCISNSSTSVQESDKIPSERNHELQQLLPDSLMNNLSLEEPNISETLSEFEALLRGDNDRTFMSTPITVPSSPATYIDTNLIENKSASSCLFDFSESIRGYTVASAPCPVVMATINGRTQLTSQDSDKKTLELELAWTEDHLSYQPGDALCVACQNDSWEVEYMIERLNLSQHKDNTMQLSIQKQTTKRNPVIPKHIPSSCTVLDYFRYCTDIRAVVKKGVLLGLSEVCSDDIEKKRLQWLASRQGSRDYNSLILQAHVDILDVLHAFPSCNPPLARVIEYLPRLQQRYYSVASSPLVCSNSTKIVFNVSTVPSRSWKTRKRYGICSGWFDSVSSNLLPSQPIIPLFTRLKNPFSLPSDNLLPIIMVGPGTGLSPFIGFLDHRQALVRNGVRIGPAWLFFGCRHPMKDYLYKDRLVQYTTLDGGNVLTHFHTSFSRLEGVDSSNNVKYVQDNIRKHKEELSKWIIKDNAIVYVCGDAKHMAKNIRDAFVDVIQYYIDKYDPSSNKSAVQFIDELVEQQRYRIDQWI